MGVLNYYFLDELTWNDPWAMSTHPGLNTLMSQILMKIGTSNNLGQKFQNFILTLIERSNVTTWSIFGSMR